MRIAVVANTTWYLSNFRLNLMLALESAGHEVFAVGPKDSYVDKLKVSGIKHCVFPLVGSSINPFHELGSIWALQRVFQKQDIDLVLTYTPKGNIYGAIAAAWVGILSVPNVSGLGQVFVRKSVLTWLVKKMYRLTLVRASRVLFQNQEDMDMFVSRGLVQLAKSERIPGSGVDLQRFNSSSRISTICLEEKLQKGGNVFGEVGHARSFLLVARLLWDKGVGVYVDAARKVREKHPSATFSLLGFIGEQNPSAIPASQVDAWVQEGVVRYLGPTDDVKPYLQNVDCVVLPSYYKEGVPRTLLEAAAMGKPLITSNAPGCRDTVDDGITGFLCRMRDVDDLAAKMSLIVEMSTEEIKLMGKLGRKKMELEFDEKLVINRYLEIVSDISGESRS